jgi:hypothetical protein
MDKLFVFRDPVGAEKDLTSFFSEIGRSCGSVGLDFGVVVEGLNVCPENGIISTGSVSLFFFQAHF